MWVIHIINLQQLTCHNTLLIQNYYTLHVILKTKTKGEISDIRNLANDNIVGRTGISDKVHFMICQACLWCASYISPEISSKMATVTKDSASLTKCPYCVEGNIELRSKNWTIRTLRKRSYRKMRPADKAAYNISFFGAKYFLMVQER